MMSLVQLNWDKNMLSCFYCSRGDVLDETMRAIRKSVQRFVKIPITQWQNTQWITTRKLPLPERL